MGTPAAVKVGPGLLYVAPIGTTEPTTGSAALPSAWVAIGYTDNGSMFNSELSFEEIEVEEELDPIRTTATKRVTTVDFEMAEINATHLAIAFNGGTRSNFWPMAPSTASSPSSPRRLVPSPA